MAAKPEAQKIHDAMAEKFGPRSVMMASQMPRYPKYSTGSISLDLATGCGGWPSDRMVEVFGAEQCGKTTLGLLGMSNFLDAQPKRGALILDTEHKLDVEWLATLVGEERLDKRIIYSQPDDIEQACEIYKEAVKSGFVCFVLFDSIASAITRKSMDTEKDEMTGNARQMARFAPIMANLTAKYQCCTYAVNQTRDDVAGFHRIITPGGHAPKHNAVMRVYLKKAKGEVFEDINGERVKVGGTVAAKIVKNQAGGIEGRTCQWWFMSVRTEKWGFGVDQAEEIAQLGAMTSIVTRKGAWYHHPSLPDGKICGADQFSAHIKAHPELQAQLRVAIIEQLRDRVSEVAPVQNPNDLDEAPVAELFRQGVFGEE